MATWYEQRGEGDPLVLLHPGMADARAFDPNIDALAARFRVYTPERRGIEPGEIADGPGPGPTRQLCVRDPDGHGDIGRRALRGVGRERAAAIACGALCESCSRI